MTVGALHAEGAAALAPREGLPDPSRESRWLLAQALGRSEAWVLAHADAPVAPAAERLYRGWLARRAAGEPAHYVVGSCPFWGRSFAVSPAVLIPRPETELIVECVLRLDVPAAARVLDVGTGCGCLALTLALELPQPHVIATDVSPAALAVARANAAALGARASFAAADLVAALRGAFDLVVANLPYLPDDDLPALAVEIRGHEPHLALAGGPDGADLVRALVRELPRLLAPGGYALLEMGPRQRGAVEPEIAATGLAAVERGLDRAGTERVLVLRRP